MATADNVHGLKAMALRTTCGMRKLSRESFDLLFVSHNLRGCKEAHHIEEMVGAMRTGGFSVGMFQETWRTGGDTLECCGYTMLHSGLPNVTCKRGRLGVAIAFSPQMKAAWESAGSQRHVYGDRVIATRFRVRDVMGKVLTLFVASAYAPIGAAPLVERLEFDSCVRACINDCGRDEIFVCGMDANASLGVRSPWVNGVMDRDRVRGPHGIAYRNDAGRRLANLLGDMAMCSAATFYKKRCSPHTWTHPASGKPYQLDHMIVRQCDLKRVRDAGSFRRWGKDSDHRPVILRLAVMARHFPMTKRVARRPDLSLLRDPEVAAAFCTRVADARAGYNGGSDLLECTKAAIMVGMDGLPRQRGRRSPGWYEAGHQTLAPLIALRLAAQEAYMSDPSDSTRATQRDARRRMNRATDDAYSSWASNLVESVNDQHRQKGMCPGLVWQIVERLRDGKKGTVRPPSTMTLRKDDGTDGLCTTPVENADVTKRYLAKSFSRKGTFDTAAINMVKQRTVRPELDAVPQLDEVMRCVMAIRSGGAAGDDGISPVVYKTLMSDPTTQHLIMDLVHRMWTTGEGYVDTASGGDMAPVADPVEEVPVIAADDGVEAALPDGYKAWSPAHLWNFITAVGRDYRLTMVAYDDIAPANRPRNRTNGLSTVFQKVTLALGGRAVTPSEFMALVMSHDGISRQGCQRWVKQGWVTIHHPLAPAAPEPPPATAAVAMVSDKGGVIWSDWLSARIKLLPKKGDLSMCKNWRAICLLDVASKIFSRILVGRMQSVQEEHGLEEQSGFRGLRGTIDGLFSVSVALQKRKEHNLDTWALFIDLVKAFDSVSREALFLILLRFGMPPHFVNLVARLHTGAVVKFTVGDVDKTVDSSIGVRQGSCEGPVLFLFIIQAAIETMAATWPVDIPEFCTTADGALHGMKGALRKKRGDFVFQLWRSLFADDCALLFGTRADLIVGTRYLYAHLRKFGLMMHVGRGGATSKTEAMYIPGARSAKSDGDASSFAVDDGHVSFCTAFKYLGSIIDQSLRADADIDRRIASATAVFGALRFVVFQNRRLSMEVKGRVYVTLVLSILLYGSECWSMREDLLRRMRSFHNGCVRMMCRVTRAHVIRHHISTASLLHRLRIWSLDEYYHNRLLRWAGHVARMDVAVRIPRQLLTAWVHNPRPIGRPAMTFGHTLQKALRRNGLPLEFAGPDGWRDLAQDRLEWRRRTTPAPRPDAIVDAE